MLYKVKVRSEQVSLESSVYESLLSAMAVGCRVQDRLLSRIVSDWAARAAVH